MCHIFGEETRDADTFSAISSHNQPLENIQSANDALLICLWRTHKIAEFGKEE